jgi:hypothetical protein
MTAHSEGACGLGADPGQLLRSGSSSTLERAADIVCARQLHRVRVGSRANWLFDARGRARQSARLIGDRWNDPKHPDAVVTFSEARRRPDGTARLRHVEVTVTRDGLNYARIPRAADSYS